MHGRENREENGKKGETRAELEAQREVFVTSCDTEGQTDGANGERKRDSNCEKGSWRNRE